MRLYLYIDAPIVVGREEKFGLGCLRRLLLQKVGGDAQHFGELKTADFQFFAGWGGVDCELMSNIVFDTFMFVIWLRCKTALLSDRSAVRPLRWTTDLVFELYISRIARQRGLSALAVFQRQRSDSRKTVFQLALQRYNFFLKYANEY